MTDINIVQLLMLLAGTGLFMVAGFAVCVALMIFCDIINLSGSFDKIGGTVITIVFIPVLLAGRIVDVVTGLFVSEEIKRSLRPATVSAETNTITV